MELGELGGLGEKLIHAGLATASTLIGQRCGAERDHGQAGSALPKGFVMVGPGSEPAGGFPAVEPRHVAIHQNHIRERSRGERGEGLLAIVDNRMAATELGELGGEDFLIHQVVFGHKHVQREFAGGRRGFW